MADVLDIAAAAVVGEHARLVVALFGDPQSDHRFGLVGTGRPRPQILALRLDPGLIGRMFEPAGRGELVRPHLGVRRKVAVPGHWPNADFRPRAVLRRQQPRIETCAVSGTTDQQRTRQQERGREEKRGDDAVCHGALVELRTLRGTW